MTVRLSHKKRPPFLFSQRARVNQLVCAPRPYVRAWAEDGRPLWAPCLAWSPGPVELATTGDGSYQTLFGENWLAQICQDGSWALYKRIDNEVLEVVPWDVVPPTVGITARHPTMCFDQGARPSIAWEDSQGIRLREFNETTGLYHFVGPFEGVDPVLLMDATVNRWVPDSDVILWYLSADRLTLKYRIQRENFATEHDHHMFDSPMVLDAVDTGRYRFQLKHGDESGSIIPSGDSFQALVSDLYPVYLQDDVNVTGDAVEGEYARAAWSPHETETVLVASEALAGTYASTVLRETAGEEPLDVTSAALAGAYAAVVTRYQAGEEPLDVAGEAVAGAYALAAIRNASAEPPLSVAAQALEGAYSPA